MHDEIIQGIDGFEVSVAVLERQDKDNCWQNDINEDDLAGLSAVDVSGRAYRYVKRGMDIVCAFLAIAVLSVPFLLVSLAIYMDDPGPVFFRQYRVGLHGKRFRVYKFRSMKTDTPKYLSTTEFTDSSTYVTRVGRFIRKFSIDELPQLINVLLGDMSLVGPRPLISDEYAVHKMRIRFGVYNIRPGITGWAQINGRDAVSAAEKVRYDVQYLESYGFWEDVKILFLTIPKIVKASDVSEGH